MPDRSESERDELRRRMRARRAGLRPDQRSRAGAALAEVLSEWPAFARARHIAGYHAMGGEIDPAPALAAANAAGKRVYLPVLAKETKSLKFALWSEKAPMRKNRFGIPEPQGQPSREPGTLDLVLVPLVACDRRGNRLGMGGGFYDATFAYRRKRPESGPLLAGAAHEFQVVDTQPPQPWDVPLDFIVTPSGIIDCR